MPLKCPLANTTTLKKDGAGTVVVAQSTLALKCFKKLKKVNLEQASLLKTSENLCVSPGRKLTTATNVLKHWRASQHPWWCHFNTLISFPVLCVLELYMTFPVVSSQSENFSFSPWAVFIFHTHYSKRFSVGKEEEGKKSLNGMRSSHWFALNGAVVVKDFE